MGAGASTQPSVQLSSLSTPTQDALQYLQALPEDVQQELALVLTPRLLSQTGNMDMGNGGDSAGPVDSTAPVDKAAPVESTVVVPEPPPQSAGTDAAEKVKAAVAAAEADYRQKQQQAAEEAKTIELPEGSTWHKHGGAELEPLLVFTTLICVRWLLKFAKLASSEALRADIN